MKVIKNIQKLSKLLTAAHLNVDFSLIGKKLTQNMKNFIIFVLISLLTISTAYSQDTDLEESTTNEYQVEGKVFPPELASDENYKNWVQNTDIVLHANSGIFKGFLKSDGTFVINKVPSGSFILEVLNPDYVYEQVRVEINAKGKFRARKVSQ